MNFKDFLKSKELNEGGNISIFRDGKTLTADKIDLQRFSILNFREEFFKLFSALNKKFKEKFDEPLWKDENDLRSGVLFNGSTSYIMNKDLNPDDILKHKKHAGDVDIMVPKEHMRNLWDLLKELENKKFAGFTYLGNNRDNPNAIGTQINALFKFHNKQGDINCQVDFEEADFEDDKPTEWSRFAHGSSFEDAQKSIKAFHHKLLLRALTGALTHNPNIVIATPSSTPKKITLKKTKDTGARMGQFSVDRGLGFGYEPLLDEKGEQIFMDGKAVYKEKKVTDKVYIQDLETIFDFLFNTKQDIQKFYSFIGLVELLKKHADKQSLEDTRKRYFEILFGYGAQIIESYSADDDYSVKIIGYDYFLKYLHLKHATKEKEIKEYYKRNAQKFEKQQALKA